MSRRKFDENCKGCQPAMFDATTGEVLPEDHPHMVIALALWDQTPRWVKEAWHRVTCLNSRDALDVRRAHSFVERLTEALKPQSSN